MKYLVAGPNPAYDAMPGDTVTLNSTDPGVALNVAAGVLVAQGTAVMTCPACVGAEQARVAVGELEAHYGEAHPALVAPEWRED